MVDVSSGDNATETSQSKKRRKSCKVIYRSSNLKMFPEMKNCKNRQNPPKILLSKIIFRKHNLQACNFGKHELLCM